MMLFLSVKWQIITIKYLFLEESEDEYSKNLINIRRSFGNIKVLDSGFSCSVFVVVLYFKCEDSAFKFRGK